MKNPDSERGSGSVLMLGVVAVAVLLFGAAATLASAQQASARARTAADLAALAAAGAVARAESTAACAAASQVAAANGAALVRCSDLGAGDFEVVVTVRPRSRVLGPATARSRAGPEGAGSHAPARAP